MSELGKAADAFPLFAHAAKAGFAEAEHRVALCYFGGLGVPASCQEGVRWLRARGFARLRRRSGGVGGTMRSGPR